jgi:hypothetical protein
VLQPGIPSRGLSLAHDSSANPVQFLFHGSSRPPGPYPGGTPTVPAVVAGYMHRDPKDRTAVLTAVGRNVIFLLATLFYAGLPPVQ